MPEAPEHAGVTQILGRLATAFFCRAWRTGVDGSQDAVLAVASAGGTSDTRPRRSAGSRMRQAMAHRDPSSPTPLPTILRYGIAVLSVAIATGLGFFLLQHFEARLTPFLFAVAATVWYAGTGPGVLAIVLSVLSLNYLFLRPFFSFSPISYADLVALQI
jgi:K+-sensing histidine kinase KdpD